MKIYLLTDNEGLYKIGRSNNVKKRLVNIQVGNPKKLEILYEVEAKAIVETILKRQHKQKRTSGEWFMLEPIDVLNFVRDCEELDEQLQFIKNNSTLDNHPF